VEVREQRREEGVDRGGDSRLLARASCSRRRTTAFGAVGSKRTPRSVYIADMARRTRAGGGVRESSAPSVFPFGTLHKNPPPPSRATRSVCNPLLPPPLPRGPVRRHGAGLLAVVPRPEGHGHAPARLPVRAVRLRGPRHHGAGARPRVPPRRAAGHPGRAGADPVHLRGAGPARRGRARARARHARPRADDYPRGTSGPRTEARRGGRLRQLLARVRGLPDLLRVRGTPRLLVQREAGRARTGPRAGERAPRAMGDDIG
jgi:hypothetical protein